MYQFALSEPDEKSSNIAPGYWIITAAAIYELLQHDL